MSGPVLKGLQVEELRSLLFILLPLYHVLRLWNNDEPI